MLVCTTYEALRAKLLRETGLIALTEGDLQLMKKVNYPYFTNLVYGWKVICIENHFIGRPLQNENDVGTDEEDRCEE